MDLSEFSRFVVTCLLLLLLTQVRCDQTLVEPALADCVQEQCLEGVARRNLSQSIGRLNSSKHSDRLESLYFSTHPLGGRRKVEHQPAAVATSNQTGANLMQSDTTKGSSAGSLPLEARKAMDFSARLRSRDPLSRETPKWWDACSRQVVFNNTLINLLMEPRIYHPGGVIMHDRKERGKYMKSLSAFGNNTDLDVLVENDFDEEDDNLRVTFEGLRYKRGQWRHKRWTITTLVDYNRDSSGKNEIVSRYKDPLVVKKPDKAKKTSFSMSPPKKYWSSIGKSKATPNKSRYYQANNPMQSSETFDNNPMLANNAATSNKLAKQVSRESSAMLVNRARELYHLILRRDVRASWQLHGILISLKSLEGLIWRADPLRYNTTSSNLTSTREQELEAQGSWLPELSKLGRDDKLSRSDLVLYKPSTFSALINMTHYLEFFNVAIEQMLSEQIRTQELGGKHNNIYRLLERFALRLQCQSESMISSIEIVNKERQELKYIVDRLLSLRQLTLDGILGEGRLFANTSSKSRGLGSEEEILNLESTTVENLLDSPLTRAIVDTAKQRRQANETRATSGPRPSGDSEMFTRSSPKHIWRDIMPMSQRKLHKDNERVYRNHLILLKLRTFISFYVSLVEKNYS